MEVKSRHVQASMAPCQLGHALFHIFYAASFVFGWRRFFCISVILDISSAEKMNEGVVSKETVVLRRWK